MPYIKENEIMVYLAVQRGEMEIDSEGRVWRIATRGGDRWRKVARTNKCERRRAEHLLPLGYLQVRAMIDKITRIVQFKRRRFG